MWFQLWMMDCWKSTLQSLALPCHISSPSHGCSEGCCSAHNSCINIQIVDFFATNFLTTFLHVWQLFYVQRHLDYLSHARKPASDEDWMKIFLRDQYTVRFADPLACSLLMEVNSCKTINNKTWGNRKVLPKVIYQPKLLIHYKKSIKAKLSKVNTYHI